MQLVDRQHWLFYLSSLGLLLCYNFQKQWKVNQHCCVSVRILIPHTCLWRRRVLPSGTKTVSGQTGNYPSLIITYCHLLLPWDNQWYASMVSKNVKMLLQNGSVWNVLPVATELKARTPNVAAPNVPYYINLINPNQFTWSLFCLGNLISFSRGEIIIQKIWENLTFIFSLWRLIFSQKIFFFIFFKKCQKRLQVNWLLISWRWIST